jgi:serine/threonine protein kinase
MKHSSLKEFKVLCMLGQGSYSKVYKVLRSEDQKTYALKKVQIDKLNKKEQKNALNEVRILASLHNAHIVAYYVLNR